METAKDLRKIQEIGKLALKLIKQIGLSSRSMQIDLFVEWNKLIKFTRVREVCPLVKMSPICVTEGTKLNDENQQVA